MAVTAEAFSRIVNGSVVGDPDIIITGVSGLEDAKQGDVTFLSSPKFLKFLLHTKASCILLKEPMKDSRITQIIVENPYYAFAKALDFFYPPGHVPRTISDQALIADSAVIGGNVAISPFVQVSQEVIIGEGSVLSAFVFVGPGSKIGKQCIIHPNVTIRENVQIGDRVVIHAGSVIGSDGFGYVFEKGEHYKIPQVGGVIIEDDVEIGSNVSIDRATIGNTLVGKGTKIDNLVQIGHNVQIGEKALLVAHAAVGGSSRIGDHVILAGQVGVADHTTIDSGTIIGARSGLMGHYAKGVYSGAPAIPHRNWLRSQSLFAKLPEMNRKIKELEEKLDLLVKGDEE